LVRQVVTKTEAKGAIRCGSRKTVKMEGHQRQELGTGFGKKSARGKVV